MVQQLKTSTMENELQGLKPGMGYIGNLVLRNGIVALFTPKAMLPISISSLFQEKLPQNHAKILLILLILPKLPQML